MGTDPRVSELLLRWQELRQAGQAVTAADLCADCPELAAELQRRMEVVDYWEGFLGPEDEMEVPTPAPIPTSFGKFPVVRALGGGGQGSTLLAFDPDLRCHVVLKLYHRARTPAEQEVVLREGQALARVRSPYVAACRGVERQDGVPALVVEYVPGRDLKEQQRARPLNIGAALELMGQLAEGLAAVHACGLLHRDLKPANVLVGDDGRPRLVDFGLAVPVASTDLAGAAGTLPYMAPEQARGEAERIDPRSDVYGLGAVLYELLTGRPPHRGDTLEELRRAACAGDVVPPRQLNRRVPRAVNDLCLRCLAKDPAQRFASAAALATAVRRLRWRRKLRWPLAVAALLLVLAAFGPGLFGGGRPSGDGGKGPPVRPEEALSGELVVRVWSEFPGGKRGLRVEEPGAVPVRDGERVHLRAELTREAYVYLLWIDAEGKVDVYYPWDREKDDLSVPPPSQKPRRVVDSPAALDKGWGIEGDGGLETILLLARREPLPAGVKFDELFAGLLRTPLRDPHEVAVVGFDGDRPLEFVQLSRGGSKTAEQIDDPLLRLMERLRPHFEVIRAVRFAHKANP